jgi:hypothetical protein
MTAILPAASESKEPGGDPIIVSGVWCAEESLRRAHPEHHSLDTSRGGTSSPRCLTFSTFALTTRAVQRIVHPLLPAN